MVMRMNRRRFLSDQRADTPKEGIAEVRWKGAGLNYIARARILRFFFTTGSGNSGAYA